MDETDEEILSALSENSRLPNIELAQKLGISEGTVRNRIQRMVEGKAIRRFTVELSTGAAFTAFTLIEAEPNASPKKLVSKLKSVKGVRRVFELAGNIDFMAEIVTGSALSCNETLDAVRAIPGVRKTETLTVLRIN
ncbi:MAG: Lrp/AsnC family transcriptional regulator [Candidatus ainarchaeum sp.]|nr:Lrp/AsnC family transcriptional regulator [Candidatus ainarchaeum sp.]